MVLTFRATINQPQRFTRVITVACSTYNESKLPRIRTACFPWALARLLAIFLGRFVDYRQLCAKRSGATGIVTCDESRFDGLKASRVCDINQSIDLLRRIYWTSILQPRAPAYLERGNWRGARDRGTDLSGG